MCYDIKNIFKISQRHKDEQCGPNASAVYNEKPRLISMRKLGGGVTSLEHPLSLSSQAPGTA